MGNGRAGNRRPATEVAPVMRNSKAEKVIAGRLSTKADLDAWKQAEREADKFAPEEPNCHGKTGKKGKEKDKRLSSRNLNRTGRKKGTARKNILLE